MTEQFFTAGWEGGLRYPFFPQKAYKYRAYICSPLRAGTREEYVRNIISARAYTFYTRAKTKFLARAPHAFLPMLLRDDIADERALALRFGLELLSCSAVVLVCGDRLSQGMMGEIEQAVLSRKRIIVFNEELFRKVQQFVRSYQDYAPFIELDTDHPILAHPAPQTCY